jgi:hypothetical protein
VGGIERILRKGPIPYDEIELRGDPDLDQALHEEGLVPQSTSYRLIDIPLTSICDVRTMPWKALDRETPIVQAVRGGKRLPPVVVKKLTDCWTLLDGVNRTCAYFYLHCERVEAYELNT